MADHAYDVAIIGAGPVGSALALGLQGSGLSVALVARPHAMAASGAVRAIALSYASRLILERFGAWASLATTRINRIHVSQAGRFGRTWISREDVALPALGYVTPYDRIAPGLDERLDPGAVQRLQAAVPPDARLVVHAEGSPGAASVESDYHHTAIVATVSCERPADGVAWERFTGEGPLALLPLGSDYALVWSRTSTAAEAAMRLSDREFIAALQTVFGDRVGRFTSVGARAATPLSLRYRTGRTTAGEVHIGNAAQTLHPVAGQGLNLGLRDAWDLAASLKNTPREQHGSADFARRFARARCIDAQATIRATDLLATLYVRRDPLSAAVRGAMLAGFDIFPAARRLLARSMIYGPGAR